MNADTFYSIVIHMHLHVPQQLIHICTPKLYKVKYELADPNKNAQGGAG